MVDLVLIKEVSGQPILLHESKDTNYNRAGVIWIVAILTFTFAAWYFGDPHVFPMGIITGIVIGGMLAAVDSIGSDGVPAYAVTSGHIYKTVRMVNPTEDQQAICKAAQEIEQQILEAHRRKRELEEIAAGCK